MANRLFTGTTCNNGLTFTFIADDLIITANPINRVYQLVNGTCITVTSSGATTSSDVTQFISFGPYTSCTQCITPINSAGIESVICASCDSVNSVTAKTVSHAIYINSLGKAVSQINTIALGGFNGLNN
jgi:hypothetical protein